MAIPAYSDTGLPHSPLVDSWEQPQIALPPTASEMDGGNKRLRNEPGNSVEFINFEVMMSQAQYETFKTFYKTTLGNGASRFTMNVWLGNGFSVKTVQFENTPTPTTVHPKIRVHFELRVFP